MLACLLHVRVKKLSRVKPEINPGSQPVTLEEVSSESSDMLSEAKKSDEKDIL